MSRLLSSLLVALALSLFAVVILPSSPQVAEAGGDGVAAVSEVADLAEAPGSDATEAEAALALDLHRESQGLGRPGRDSGVRRPVEALCARPGPPPRATV